MKRYKPRKLGTALKYIDEMHAKQAREAELIKRLTVERLLLAKLAADKPMFSNPLVAMEAKSLRDSVLGSC